MEDAPLVWFHQLLLQANLHLRRVRREDNGLMFYSCWTDSNDTKTPSSFILESDREGKQEVIDLKGSL